MRDTWRGADVAFRRFAVPRLAAALVAGASLNLAFAPFAWWPLGFLAPAALFALIRGVPARRAAAVGAAFGVGLYAAGTYWLYTCLHVYGLVPVWLTLVLQAVLVAILSGYSAVLCYAANRLWLKPGASRDWLVLPALWVLLEWLRGWALSGFPWLSLGYAFIDTPLAGWAPAAGVYGVTWAAALAAAGVYVAADRSSRPMQRARALAVVGVMFLLSMIAQQWPIFAPRWNWTRPVGGPIPVAVVQGAVSQNLKWQADNRDATMDRYLKLTERAWGARLIVWPESALPVLSFEITDYLDDLRRKGRDHGADFAIGMVDYRPQTRQYFNGLLVLGAAGESWYYKRHLVPFGEYFPVPSWVRSWMRLMSLPYDDFTAGPPRQPALLAAGQTLGVTICYEDAFGSSQLEVLREATLLVNVTNNAWFGDSTAPHQHLQIARMRALEAGRFLIRSTNDGITAVIDARGEIVARLPQFQQAVLRAQVQPRTGLTPYARVGNYPVVLGGLGALALASWRRRREH